MEIIALQDYTDKYVSLYEGEVRNIGKNLANKLIAKGIVAEHDEIDGGSDSGGSDSPSGSGIFWVTGTQDESGSTIAINKSYNEIVAAVEAGMLPILLEPFTRTEYDAEDIPSVISVELGTSILGLSNYSIYNEGETTDSPIYTAQFSYVQLASTNPDAPMTKDDSSAEL